MRCASWPTSKAPDAAAYPTSRRFASRRRHGGRSYCATVGLSAAHELCVLTKLRNRLRAGDSWVAASREYRAFESYILPPATFDARRARGSLPLAIDTDFDSFTAGRRASPDTAIEQVTALTRQGEWPQVRLDGNCLVLSPLKALMHAVSRDMFSRCKIESTSVIRSTARGQAENLVNCQRRVVVRIEAGAMGMRSKVIFWIGCSVAEFIMAVTLLIAATKPRGAAFRLRFDRRLVRPGNTTPLQIFPVVHPELNRWGIIGW